MNIDLSAAERMPHGITEQYDWLEKELAALIGEIAFSAEINLRLERIIQLLDLLGNPHYDYRSVHVGGTSGKGSTSTMIASILTAAGYKVGLHTSPHLQILNERHRINGRMAPTSKLAALWQQMKPAVEEVKATSPYGRPSYFEAQVALSFLLFREEKVDIAVVEVGLGGTLDSTNVLPADVAVLTNVGLDHMEILGDTVEKIAQDKVGIIKPGQRVISGCSQPTVQQIVAQRCAAKGAQLWQLGRDFRYEATAEHRVSVYGPLRTYTDLEIGLTGPAQMQNAAVAVAAVQALTTVGFDVTESALRPGLATLELEGRVETIQQNPLVILDGAHNEDKIKSGAAYIAQVRRPGQRVITVLGIKAGKAAHSILPPVIEQTDSLILTSFINKGLWKATPPTALAELAQSLNPDLPMRIVADPLEAVADALAEATADDIVWVTGSLYLIGDVRSYWRPIADLLPALEADG